MGVVDMSNTSIRIVATAQRVHDLPDARADHRHDQPSTVAQHTSGFAKRLFTVADVIQARKETDSVELMVVER